MKRRFLSLLTLICIFSSLHAQFHWEHTNGPEGAYAGPVINTDNYAFFSDDYHFYRTGDGQSWEIIDTGSVWSMATLGNTIVVQQGPGWISNFGQPFKIKVSHDNGESWTEGNFPSVLLHYTNMAVSNLGIYVVENGRVYHSQDDGLNWDTLYPGVSNAYNIWSFDDRVYVANENSVSRTDATGSNWAQYGPVFTNNDKIRGVFASGDHLMIGTNKGLWYSNDDGATWSLNNVPGSDGFHGFIQINQSVYMVGETTQFARTGDFGATWVKLPSNAIPYRIYELIKVNDVLLASSSDNGVFRWNEQAQTFIEANKGIFSAGIDAIEVGAGKLWAVAPPRLWAYDFAQNSWSSTPALIGLPGSWHNQSISANSSGIVCYGATHQKYFLASFNNGQSWDTISMPQGSWGQVTDFDRIKVIDNNIFVWEENYGSVYRSSDFGHTWKSLTLPADFIVKFDNKYLASFAGAIYASTDEGITWSLHTSFPNRNIGSLVPVGNKILSFMVEFTGAGRRSVFISDDGITWKYAHDGLPNLNFGYDPDGGHSAFFEHQGKYYAYHSYAGFFGSNDTCSTWLPLEKRGENTVALSDSTFFAGAFVGGIIRSTAPENIYGTLASGLVYSDDNNNGTKDGTENIIPNIPVHLVSPDFYAAYSGMDGKYALGIFPGTGDTLRPKIRSNYVEHINPPFYLAGNGGTNLDFGIKWTQNISDLTIAGSYWRRPTPGFEHRISVQYGNAGTVSQDAVISLKLDANLVYLEANPSPNGVYGDSLVWSLPQFPILGDGNILIRTILPNTVPLATPVICTGRIQGQSSDVTPDNNILVLTDTVTGPYDPNEKRVLPPDGLTAAEITAGKELQYTIYFQNTGTAEATRVRITDMLDTALYLPSLRLVSASHTVSGFRLLPGGLLEVVFDGIALPDSSANEAGSHGFVSFAIQRKKAFNPNHPVYNTAAIYFDFNEPIFTNQVASIVKSETSANHEPDVTEPPGLTVYPNPSQGTFTVFGGSVFSGTGFLTVENLAGQVCQQIRVSDLSQPIQVRANHWADGMYFIRLAGEERVAKGRVLLQKGQ